MNRSHHYQLTTKWTGNRGTGTSEYRAYDRSHSVIIDGKSELACSSDPNFRGDKSKHNPEELFIAALSGCHMLWFLHLCADAGVVVNEYTDRATGTMIETEDGGGHFAEVILHPEVIVSDAKMIEKTHGLHERAHKLCFIANSCNFPVHHNPTCKTSHA